MKLLSFIFGIVFLTTITTTAQQQQPDTLTIFPVDSTDADIENWDVIEFDDIKPASYAIERVDGELIVKGESNGEASGLGKSASFTLEDYPIMEWKWKVDEIPEKGNAKKKDGDDYGVRIYITFKFEKYQGNIWERSKYWTVKNVFRVDNLPFR